jgi:hypothetical protein
MTPGAAKDPFDTEFRTRLSIALAVVCACGFTATGLGAAAGRIEARVVLGVVVVTLLGLGVAYLLGGERQSLASRGNSPRGGARVIALNGRRRRRSRTPAAQPRS